MKKLYDSWRSWGRYEKALSHLNSELSKIRLKPNPSMLDTVRVDYYGSQPLSQIGNIGTLDLEHNCSALGEKHVRWNYQVNN